MQDAWQVSLQANRCRFSSFALLCFVTYKSKQVKIFKVNCFPTSAFKDLYST